MFSCFFSCGCGDPDLLLSVNQDTVSFLVLPTDSNLSSPVPMVDPDGGMNTAGVPGPHHAHQLAVLGKVIS